MKVADVQLKMYAVLITTRSILGNVKMPFVLPVALTDTGVGTMATTGKPITRRCHTTWNGHNECTCITGCKARVYSRMAIIATGIPNGIFAAGTYTCTTNMWLFFQSPIQLYILPHCYVRWFALTRIMWYNRVLYTRKVIMNARAMCAV